MDIKKEILKIIELCMELDNVSVDVNASVPAAFIYVFDGDKIVESFYLYADNKTRLSREENKENILECKKYLRKLLKEKRK